MCKDDSNRQRMFNGKGEKLQIRDSKEFEESHSLEMNRTFVVQMLGAEGVVDEN
jgi:hypothetical protein